MTYKTLDYQYQDGVARIVLNRPERLNALTPELLGELADALAQLQQQSELRVLVITGAGRGFCAGADLAGGLPSAPGADIGLVLEKFYNPVILALRDLAVPIVAVVNGVAAGAGASLALAADLVIATHAARFVLAFARIGLVPDAGLSYFLTERIGVARALGVALLGDEIDAREAERVGLIWKAVPDDELQSAAESLIARLAAAPTAALALTKRAMYAAHAQTLSAQLQLEREYQARLGATHDFQEGVGAFRQKRPARFIGR